MEWLVGALAVAVLLALYLSWTAGRVDRLHARVDATRAVLDAQLLRRSGAALEVATGGLLDPASSLVVADAAHNARAATSVEREQAESDLTRTLVVTFADPEFVLRLRDDEGARLLLDELATACRRVEQARRFHNDTVRSAQRLRRRALVRLFRLAGRTPLPETMEFDDEVSPGLAR